MHQRDTNISSTDANSGCLRSDDADKPLAALLSPRTVALIGATDRPGSVGESVLRNLLQPTFQGRVYPVNPKHTELLGQKTYRSIADAPEAIDLAVIATPADTVPGVLTQCVASDVKAAIVLTAGFKESGASGQALEKRVADIVRSSGMRLLGPNCLGAMSPKTGLNATFADGLALPGSAALLSQSGALCTSILDWSRRELVGFSGFVSTGSMLDIGWADLIRYFADDGETRCILIYMESIGDVRSFASAARAAALKKPIVVLKAGRTAQAAQAAMSHTGALSSPDDAIDAVFERCGVLRVDTVAELFYMAEALVKQPPPKGPRLTIVTNAGGPGVLATDALIRCGGELSRLEPSTIEQLDAVLPAHWSRSNPVDVLGNAGPDSYGKAAEIAASDPNTDGILAILTPQSMSDPSAAAHAIAAVARTSRKPILGCWMGADRVAEGRAILAEAGIPSFPYPDTAARIFRLMRSHSENLENLFATPVAVERDAPEPAAVDAWLRSLDCPPGLLAEADSKKLLALYGIESVRTEVAHSALEAAEKAAEIGFPVAVKIHSHRIAHKSDFGGVRLGIGSKEETADAFRQIEAATTAAIGSEAFEGVTVQAMAPEAGIELILGSSNDPQIGPVLLFGAGGRLVETFRDTTLALPPLTSVHALRMIGRTRISRALAGVRGAEPIDMAALAQTIVRFADLVSEQPTIDQIEINPLLVSSKSIIALDARVVLNRSDEPRSATRPMIRPYPSQYSSTLHLRTGETLSLRPIRAEDEPMLANFHETLSPDSVFHRYFAALPLAQRTNHSRLSHLCSIDYDREIALVAHYRDTHSGDASIVGVGRLQRDSHGAGAQFAIVLADAWQRRGLGRRMMDRLIAVAREEGLTSLHAEILEDNSAMIAVSRAAGFSIVRTQPTRCVRAEIDLRFSAPVASPSSAA